jgi:hypothetical protein
MPPAKTSGVCLPFLAAFLHESPAKLLIQRETVDWIFSLARSSEAANRQKVRAADK